MQKNWQKHLGLLLVYGLVTLVMTYPLVFRLNQLPVNVADKGTMILRTPAGLSNTLTFPIQNTAPSVFRVDVEGWDTQMPTVIRAENNKQVTPSNPVHYDDWLVIYTTGLGLTDPGVDSGMPGPSDELAKAIVEPVVTLGGETLPLAFAGLVPGEVGLYQINVKVPFKNVKTGMEVPLTIKQGDTSTTLNVRVVD